VPLAIGLWWLVRTLARRLSAPARARAVVVSAALPLLVGLLPLWSPGLVERDAGGGDEVAWLQHGGGEQQVSSRTGAAAVDPAAGGTTAASRPNILFILVDTLRWDHLGCYGYPLATSPTIDSLATTGLRCEQVIAASSWTRPAVATIFSGLYPSTHGLTNYYTGFPSAALLLPEMLSSQGYHTAIFSNNGHVSRNYGFSQGVDYMNGTASSTYQFFFLGALSYRFGVRLGFSPALVPLAICQHAERALMPGSSNDGTGADLNRYVRRWLEDGPPEPYFAYVHYFEPHAPYVPPSPWDALCNATAIPGFSVMPPADRDMYAPYEDGTELSPEESAYLVRRYDAEIRYQDALIRELLAAFRQHDRDRNTLVVFTSDHGEEFRDHGHWGHGKSLFHEVTEVPLIFSHPELFAAGSHYGEMIEQVDLLPTLLGLVGLPIDPAIVEGVDLAARLSPGAAAPTGARLAETASPPPASPSAGRVAMAELSQNGFEAVSIEDEQYLYIALDKRGDRRELLYDLQEDPTCSRDIAAESSAVVEMYRTQLAQKRSARLASRAQVGGAVMGEETLEKLKALGYVN
jgi:arylsulfatase A-like enzyme